MQKRDDVFDLMKGVSIILMVVGHILILRDITKYIYSFHMPLFFIISGYFYKPKNISDYFKKDFLRLVVPYLFVAAVLLVYDGAQAVYYKSADGLIGRILSIVWSDPLEGNKFGYFLPKSGSVWFLLALFWCRQLFNFLFLKSGKYLPVVILVISYAAIFLYRHLNLPLAILLAMPATFFYYIGYLVKKYDLLQKVNKYAAIMIFIFWAALAGLGSLNMAICQYRFGLIPDAAIALAGCYVVYVICKYWVMRIKFVYTHLLLWGKYSLVALCFSSIFASIFTWRLMNWVLKIYEKLGVPPTGQSIPGLLVSLLFAYIFLLIVPRTAWGRKVFSL
jgi:fucose 4-O-acetylase-like acetyltransferase